MAHCATCHNTYSTVANYDRHINNKFEHLKPASVGLRQNARGTWLMPGEKDVSELSQQRPETD